MYTVSDAYKTAMKQPVQTFKLKGTIGDASFTEDNILSGSFSITNQCCGNEAIELGQVYIGELNATFMNMDIARYSWKGKEITPSLGLKLADGTFEYIPLGVFTIDSAEWTESGVVVKAYDHMALLDKTCNVVLTEVTPYQAMQRISEETGVVFGNEESDFDNFANGTTMISENTSNDVETWRDLVSWLAQTIGCYATADREGKIVFRPFSSTSVDTIDTSHRFAGCSFSDFETRYTGVSVVNMEDQKTNYYGLDEDDALTMNLGSNPFLQYGIAATKEEMCRNILDALQAIDYVPFKASAIGSPVYDLGDVLVFSDGLADGDKKYCITKYTFHYNGSYEMEGVGKDPALATARSKVDKDISGLISNTDENTLVHYRFSNTNAIEIGDGKRETIATIKFGTSSRSSEVSLWAEVLLDIAKTATHSSVATTIEDTNVSDPPTVEELQEEITKTNAAVNELDTRMTDAEALLYTPEVMTATISYMLNGEMINYHPVETFYISGKHILALHYFIGSVNPNTVYTFVIMLEMAGASCTLDSNCVNALLEGMGLAGTAKWDGTIDVEDKFSFDIKTLLGDIKEEVNTELLTPVPVGFTDSFALNPAILLGGMTDSVSTSIVVRYFILSDTEGNPEYSSTYMTVNSDDAFVLQTSYSVISTSETVDEGYLEKLDFFTDYPELETLESVVIE